MRSYQRERLTNGSEKPSSCAPAEDDDDVRTPVISNLHYSGSYPPPIIHLPMQALSASKRHDETASYETRSLCSQKQQQSPPMVDRRQQQLRQEPLARFSSPHDAPIIMTVSARTSDWSFQSTGSGSIYVEPMHKSREDRCMPLTALALTDERLFSSIHWSAFLLPVATHAVAQIAPLLKNKLRFSILKSQLRKNSYLAPFLSSRRMMNSMTSSSSSSSTSGKVRGLPNFGQTCFLNSALQALAALDPFLVYLKQIELTNQQKLEQSSSSLPIEVVLLRILCQVNGHEESLPPSTTDLKSLLRIVAEQNVQFRSGRGGFHQQQDTQEFLQALLDTIMAQAKVSLLSDAFGGIKRPASDDNVEDAWNLTLWTALYEQRQHSASSVHAQSVTRNTRSRLQTAKSIFRSIPTSTLPCTLEAFNSSSFLAQTLCRTEEKKQEEDFVAFLPAVSSELELFHEEDNCDFSFDPGPVVRSEAKTYTVASNDALAASNTPFGRSFSKAIELMNTTTSSLTPCPFSGWYASALLCRSCHRVKPLQNTLFFDLPVVPTSVSHYMTRRRNSPLKPGGATESPCRLEECLDDFSSIERVQGVECKNCTLQAEIKRLHGEKQFQEQVLQGAVQSRRQRYNHESVLRPEIEEDDFVHLRTELKSIEARLRLLLSLDPDSDNPIPFFDRDSVDTDRPHHEKIKRTDAFKCLLLSRLPAILSIHVQRRYFDPSTGCESKTMQHVIFPEILNVAPYCAYGGAILPETPFTGTVRDKDCNTFGAPTVPINYRLMAVIEHHGGAHSGHYICFRRDTVVSSRWLWVSDYTVRSCRWDEVRRCQAYMLFYEAL